MTVENLRPLLYLEEELNTLELDQITEVYWKFTSCRKSALFHRIKFLNIKIKMLVPLYICTPILKSLPEMGLSYVCY